MADEAPAPVPASDGDALSRALGLGVPQELPSTGSNMRLAPAEAQEAVRDPANRFGRYVRVRLVGRGGMGDVWKSWDTQLGRWVALKFPRLQSATLLARLKREATAAAQVNHANVAGVYEIGEAGGQAFIAMQFVHGTTLADQRPGDPRAAVEIIRCAALGVAAAHARGVVHRDLKPANIMVAHEGQRVFVMDFGLAREASTDGTTTNFAGTPVYASPEQAGAGPIDARSDVWSLGATLHELLSGRPPFEGRSVAEILHRVMTAAPPRLRGVDADLETIVGKCLEKEPRDRYGAAQELADDLGRWQRGEPIHARPPSLPYRLRKWARRHRAMLSLAIAAAAAVAISLAAFAPALGRTRRTLDLWQRVSNVLSQAELCARAGEVERSREHLRHGVAVCEEFLKTDDVPHAHYFLGRLHDELGDTPRARRHLDRALERDPAMGEARFLRGLLAAREFVALSQGVRARRLLTRPGVRRDAGPTPAALERLLPQLVRIRDEACRDLEAPVGRSSYFDEADRDYGRAFFQTTKGDLAGAGATLRALLQRDPVHVHAMIQLAYIESVSGRDAEALALLSRAIERHRGLPLAYYLRAGLRTSAGDEEGALADCASALRLAPEEPAILLWHGMLQLKRGRHDLAMADFETALRARPADPDLLVARAAVRMSRGQYRDALQDFDAAIAADPQDNATLQMRASVRLRCGDRDGARADLDRAVAAAPDDMTALANRADLRLECGDAAGARADVDACLRREASGWRALVVQSKLQEAAGTVAEALATIERAITAPDCGAAAYMHRAKMRIDRGDHAGGEADLTTAVERDPTIADAWVKRAAVRWVGQRGAEALADVERALALERSMRAFLLRAQLRLARGEVDGAIADCDEALREEPGRREAFECRAGARLRKGDADGAIADLTEAIAIRALPETYSNRANAKVLKRDHAGALEDLRRALEIAPPHWPHRAMIERAVQEIEKQRRK